MTNVLSGLFSGKFPKYLMVQKGFRMLTSVDTARKVTPNNCKRNLLFHANGRVNSHNTHCNENDNTNPTKIKEITQVVIMIRNGKGDKRKRGTTTLADIPLLPPCAV